ncbi:Hypothetical predicted protein [Lynx pardinus]|uniref:Uncharacterized protein n=1 Tax=Lynx pardinus TaxID=191816 RepID=A0A485MYE1_LYNPA|nr:Hypothetical predicted protein [Lynx pardinus]
MANGLCLKLSVKSKGFPAKCLPVECRASERNLEVQLGVNIACAAVASRWPASRCALLQRAICCSFNE